MNVSGTVDVRSLWITRKSVDGGLHFPELLVAWDEFTIDEAHEEWAAACEAALAACEGDVADRRYITLRVSYDKIQDATGGC